MNITVDGLYKVSKSGGITSVLVAGSLGGGTASLGYTTGDGTFVPFTDGIVAIGEQYEIKHGGGIKAFIQLTGSSGADLDVQFGPIG